MDLWRVDANDVTKLRLGRTPLLKNENATRTKYHGVDPTAGQPTRLWTAHLAYRLPTQP